MWFDFWPKSITFKKSKSQIHPKSSLKSTLTITKHSLKHVTSETSISHDKSYALEVRTLSLLRHKYNTKYIYIYIYINKHTHYASWLIKVCGIRDRVVPNNDSKLNLDFLGWLGINLGNSSQFRNRLSVLSPASLSHACTYVHPLQAANQHHNIYAHYMLHQLLYLENFDYHDFSWNLLIQLSTCIEKNNIHLLSIISLHIINILPNSRFWFRFVSIIFLTWPTYHELN